MTLDVAAVLSCPGNLLMLRAQVLGGGLEFIHTGTRGMAREEQVQGWQESKQVRRPA